MSRWCDALWLHVNMGYCWKVRVSTLLIEMISLQVFKCEQALTQKQQDEKKNSGDEELKGQDGWLLSWIRLGYTTPSPV